jgi:hypothetical protein
VVVAEFSYAVREKAVPRRNSSALRRVECNALKKNGKIIESLRLAKKLLVLGAVLANSASPSLTFTPSAANFFPALAAPGARH